MSTKKWVIIAVAIALAIAVAYLNSILFAFLAGVAFWILEREYKKLPQEQPND